MHDSTISVVIPVYNGRSTLGDLVNRLNSVLADYAGYEIILVDDASQDETVSLAKKSGLKVISHKSNQGYGGNQKTCYKAALDANADIVVMVHPDHQYLWSGNRF